MSYSYYMCASTLTSLEISRPCNAVEPSDKLDTAVTRGFGTMQSIFAAADKGVTGASSTAVSEAFV